MANTIVELEKLRVKRLGGPVSPEIFFQLKDIFQMMESLGSARIEGNRTTLAEFVERVIERPAAVPTDEKMREITNLEKAIDYIETNVDAGTQITRALLSDVHKIIVEGLTPPPEGEGSRYPGTLRPIPVTITNSLHKPPEPEKVEEYFSELIEFVNQRTESKNDLLVTAVAHHRMTWIHPFDNGNGRLVRLFTYALLIKQGFKVQTGRIINPTAIFCLDRDRYNAMLAAADSGVEAAMLDWCAFVLDGLRKEIEKIDRLLDREYLTERILLPTLAFALDRQQITRQEFGILRQVVEKKDMTIKSVDLETVLGKTTPVARSRIIGGLKQRDMLRPVKKGGRIYTLGFANNYLLRGAFNALEKEGFVPASLNRNE